VKIILEFGVVNKTETSLHHWQRQGMHAISKSLNYCT